MAIAVEIKNLFKSFDTVTAVNDVSFSINAGEMFGLIGPDGAGKSTTIKILLGLINPDKGTAKIFDKDIIKEQHKIKNEVGYLSQKFSLYGDMTIDENIEFFADIHNVKNFRDRSEELLEFTRLLPFRKKLAEKLSGGMKQKLALACTLIHKPKIIFLDEPTTGVDPVSRRDFWKILSSLLKEQITIFMTTPYLDEAERCTKVALMNKGKIIAFDSPMTIKNYIQEKVLEIICSPIRDAYHLLKNHSFNDVQIFGDRLNITTNNYEKDINKIENLFFNNSIKIESNKLISPSLENIFIKSVTESDVRS